MKFVGVDLHEPYAPYTYISPSFSFSFYFHVNIVDLLFFLIFILFFFSCSFESYLLEGTSSFAYLISRHCLPAFTQEMKLRSIFRTRNASEVVIRVLGSTSQYKWISRCTWRQIYLWGSVFCALHPLYLSHSLTMTRLNTPDRSLQKVTLGTEAQTWSFWGRTQLWPVWNIQVTHFNSQSCCLFFFTCRSFQFSHVNNALTWFMAKMN